MWNSSSASALGALVKPRQRWVMPTRRSAEGDRRLLTDGGTGSAYSGCGHLASDLLGSTDALRIKDGSQVCDERTQVTGREGPS